MDGERDQAHHCTHEGEVPSEGFGPGGGGDDCRDDEEREHGVPKAIEEEQRCHKPVLELAQEDGRGEGRDDALPVPQKRTRARSALIWQL